MPSFSQITASLLLLILTRKGLPALESSHALAWVLEHREEFQPGSRVLVCLSGRGDKDMDIIEQALGL